MYVCIEHHLKGIDNQPNVSHVRIAHQLKGIGKRPDVSHVCIEYHLKESVKSQMSHMYALNIISKRGETVKCQVSHVCIEHHLKRESEQANASHVRI